MLDKDNFLTGAHVTFLTRDGKSNLRNQNGSVRKTYGLAKGSYIKFAGLSAPSKDRPLIIGEGVETTLAAMELSDDGRGHKLPAIACGGTTNLAAVTPPPAGEIIIAADNDEPGRKAANTLADRLECEGRKVRIVWPPKKGTDWNDRLLDARKPEAEWRDALADALDARQDNEPIAALEFSEYMELKFPERKLLLAPWLPNFGITMIHAQRGNGKTYFALSVANAVANGTDLCGWKSEQQGRVLYVDGELPGDDLQSRLKTLTPMPPGQFFVLSYDTFQLKKQTMPNLGEEEGRKALDRVIEKCKPQLLILDSKTTLMRSGVENEAESWAPIQDWLMQWRWKGLSIILLHHEGKSGKPRGTSKSEDVLDTMIGLRNDEDLSELLSEEGRRSVFDLEFTKHRGFFGPDCAPMQLQLQMVDGRMEWTGRKKQDDLRERIKELLAENQTHEEIAKEIGKSRQYVSKVASALRKQKQRVIAENDAQFVKSRRARVNGNRGAEE